MNGPRRMAQPILLSAFSLVMNGCAVPGPQADIADTPGIERLTYGVTLDGDPVTISALRSGDPGGRRVIYIHGTPGSGDNWADELADPLPGTEVWAIDRPGFGDSGPRGAVVSLDAQARAIEPLLARQGGGWPILVGHSLGGPVAAMLAAIEPDRVGGVALVAAAMDPDLENVLLIQRIGNAGAVSWILPRWARNANRELIALERELEGLETLMPQIRAPIAMVHGTDDALVPYDNVAFMQSRVELLELRTLDGADHFLPWNARDQIRESVARLLAESD